MFRGHDGLDELTTTGLSTLWVVHDGEVAQTEFSPSSLGLPEASVADLRGGDAAHNAAVARAVLAGEPGPVRDIVLLNAAAALAATAGVAGPDAVVPALADGYARAGRSRRLRRRQRPARPLDRGKPPAGTHRRPCRHAEYAALGPLAWPSAGR